MKNVFYLLICFSFLCSCTSNFDDVILNPSEVLKSRVAKESVTVTIEFSVQHSNSSNVPSTGCVFAQAHCSFSKNIGITSMIVPVYNAWFWHNDSWQPCYEPDGFLFLNEGYSDYTPIIASEYTSVWRNGIKIYPQYLKELYEINYVFIGLPHSTDKPEPHVIETIIPDTPEEPYDSLNSIKFPLELM